MASCGIEEDGVDALGEEEVSAAGEEMAAERVEMVSLVGCGLEDELKGILGDDILTAQQRR